MSDPKPISILHGRKQALIAKADRFLARFYHPEKLSLSLERSLVSFSFDDIPDNAVTNGAAILERYDARGTFYVSGGLCGRSFRHDVFANNEQISGLVAKGHEVGCHTYSHADSQRLSRAELADEYAQNRDYLSQHCRLEEIQTHAYPYGSVGLAQKYTASKSFHAARGVRPGLNAGQLDLMQLFAVPLYDHLYSDERVADLVTKASAQKAWLIFYSHDVAPRC